MWSGTFDVELTCFTPLEIAGETGVAGARRAKLFTDPPVFIPGTSLKGMIRSVFELVAPGCYVVALRDASSIPRDWKACDREGVCPACRTFGSIKAAGGAYRGRVSIRDARPVDETSVAKDQDSGRRWLYFGTPKWGAALYPRDEGAWQKLYLHHPQLRGLPGAPHTTGRPGEHQVHAVATGSRFLFSVSFDGLDDCQLALLDYAIALQPGMLHRLGHGKPYGMGSVQLVIRERRIFAAEVALRGRASVLDSLPASAEARRKEIEQDPSLEEFRRVALWRPEFDRPIEYPGRGAGPSGPPDVQQIFPRPYEPISLEAPSPPKGAGPVRRTIESETRTVENVTLTYRPDRQEIKASTAGGEEVGLATGDQVPDLLAALPKDLRARLKKKKTLARVVVEVRVEGNKKTLTRLGLPDGS